MAGTHRPEGILLTSEPIQAAYAALEDIARPFWRGWACPDRPWMARRSGRRARTVRLAHNAAETPYTLEEEALVEARMRALGYFE